MVKSELQVKCWSQAAQIAASQSCSPWAWIQDNKFFVPDLM